MTGVTRAQVTNIIYQDNFARVGLLNGSAPDTVNTPGATWFAANNPALNAQVQTDGSEIALTNVPGTTNGNYLNGYLPFVPQYGHVYTLSCKIAALSGGTNWVAMGFAVNPLTNASLVTIPCGAGFMYVRGDGTGVQPYRFPGGVSDVAIKAAAYGTTTNLFTVVLDTTTGTGVARGWTYRFFTNGVQVDSQGTGNAAPYMIKYVGIGADGGQGVFQQFTLVDVLARQGTPTIVEQPPARTAQVGQTATFWVGVTNDYPSAAYQWMTNNGVGGPTNAIAGATNGSYTTPTLDMSYNGLNYSVSVTNTNGSTNSVAAVLTVVSGPPTVYSVTRTANATSIAVAFSTAVDPVTGLNPANYALTVNAAPSGVSILSASYGSASNNVILQTSTLNTNTSYYLNVQNVQDLFGNAISPSTNAVLPAGLVLFMRGDSGVVFDASNNVVQWLDQTTNGNDASEFFGVPSVGILGSAGRPGTNIINHGQPSVDFGNLGGGVNLLHFLQAPSSPSLASMISNTTMYAVAYFYSTTGNDLINKTWGNIPAPFDWDPSTGENVQYGNGFNNAPAGGLAGTILTNIPYVLASTLQFPTTPGSGTTNFQFYLNGNNNGNGAIRGITGNPSAILDGGTPLWIGGRSDLQAANPKMRGQIGEILLFNTLLSDGDRGIMDNYLGNKYFTFAITTDLPASTTSSNGFAVTYTFVASAGSARGYSFQWQENGTNISGATGTTYTTPNLAPGDNGDTFDVQVSLPNGSFVYSTTNTLTVLTVPPFVTLAGIPIWNTNELIVTFDETVDPVTATAATNYSLNNGASVFSATMGDLPNKVVLATSPLSFNANIGFYQLTVQNVKDLYNNTLTTASTPVGLYPNAAVWIRANTGVTTGANGIPDPTTNVVLQWNDISGNGNTFFGGGDVTSQPIITTNAWGDPVMRFNTNDAYSNFLATAQNPTTAGISGDMSIIAVINVRSLTAHPAEIVSKSGGPSANKNIAAPYDYYLGSTGAPLYRGDGGGGGAGVDYGNFTSTQVPVFGYPSIVAVSETGSIISHYLDGQNVGTGALGSAFPVSKIFDLQQPVHRLPV